MDAAKYLKGLNVEDDFFDVVIVDSSDPVGPAETLFQLEFYQSLEKVLKPNGVVCTQVGCLV